MSGSQAAVRKRHDTIETRVAAARLDRDGSGLDAHGCATTGRC